jgi:alpha-ribazole phosphatase
MPADTIYLLRHGDSRQDDVRRYIGQTNHPLNRTGRDQAEYWRRELRTVPFERIFSSTLSRSMETATIIAQEQKVAVLALANLQEISMGAWDGLPIDEVHRHNPEEYERRGASLADYRPPGGESFNDLAARVLPLFEEIVHNSTGNLLIVGHAGVNRIILCHLLNLPRERLFELKQDYGCLNSIDRTETGLLPLTINILPDIQAHFHP